MQEGPFDDSVEQNFSKQVVQKSELKALKDAGFLMAGKAYQNKMINIVLLMNNDPRLQGIFRFNEFSGCVEYATTPSWNNNIQKGKRTDDGDELFLKHWLADKYQFEPSTGLIHEALFVYAQQQSYHPVKQYLEALSWDQQPRIDTWLHDIIGTEKNRYTSAVGRKLLCAMIRRIYHPGCKFDNLIIFEGEEGIYKSTMLNVLGGEWYAQFSIKVENKDSVDIMRGKWLLEMAELTTIKGSDIEYVDAFLSRNVDRVRLAYARNAKDFPRQCVLVGTMNPVGSNQYLKKQSQNRRFWPIACKGFIELEKLKNIRNQLFAEAMTIYQDEALYLDNDEAVKIAVEQQEARKAYDYWIDLIMDYLEGKNIVRATDVFTQALNMNKEKINHTSSIRLGICMRHLGWLPKQYGPERQKYYQRPDANFQEVHQEIGQIDWDE